MLFCQRLCGQDGREPTTELKDLNTLRNGYIVLEYRLFYFYQCRLYDPFSFKIILLVSFKKST